MLMMVVTDEAGVWDSWTQRRKQKPSRTDFGALDGVADGGEVVGEGADAGVAAVGVTFGVALGGMSEPTDRMEHSKAHPRMLKSAREATPRFPFRNVKARGEARGEGD